MHVSNHLDTQVRRSGFTCLPFNAIQLTVSITYSSLVPLYLFLFYPFFISFPTLISLLNNSTPKKKAPREHWQATNRDHPIADFVVKDLSFPFCFLSPNFSGEQQTVQAIELSRAYSDKGQIYIDFPLSVLEF